jgi:hypothetical protein
MASSAEINRELTALKRMFSLAVESGKLLHRPHLPMLKEDNVRTGFFEVEQFESVSGICPNIRSRSFRSCTSPVGDETR